MPPVRFLASKHCAHMVAVIFLLSKIMPTYSHCVSKGLVYVTIIAPLGRQPSSYTKYTKLNMYLSCNIRLVSIAKCVCLMHSYVLRSLQFPYLICLRVLCNSCCKET